MVDIEDLDFDDEQVYFHAGFPYTGVAFGEDADGRTEYTYLEGVHEGPYREWYADGQLKIDANLHRGVLHGEERNYREDGTLAQTRWFELGILLKSTSYDKDGAATDTFVIAEDSPNYSLLQTFRNRWGAG